MKVMIDTNILISAVLFPNGKASEALKKALASPYEPLICDYVLDEFKRKFDEKFPESKSALEVFLEGFLAQVEVVSERTNESKDVVSLRDPKDMPILRAALSVHADMLLTGDKDFLESEVIDPRIISVHDFIAL